MVDGDGGSGVDAVELTSLAAMAMVDQSTETAAVVLMHWSCRVWRRRRQWISRQRRRQWVCWSQAGQPDGGGVVALSAKVAAKV